MSLAGFQIIPIDLNFHLQKCLEIFDQNSADKIWSIKDKGWKGPSLMPITVNSKNIVDIYGVLSNDKANTICFFLACWRTNH